MGNIREKESFTIIAGASQCATTSFFNYLVRSGCFVCPKEKELDFWQNTSVTEVGFDVCLAAYKEKFLKESSSLNNYLEASPAYLRHSKKVAANISSLPDLKVIFIFRDPLDRFRALARKMSNEFSELSDFHFQDFCDIVLAAEGGESDVEKEIRARADVGFYGKYFEEFLRNIDHDRIKFICFDDLVAMSSELREEISRFLGVSLSALPKELHQTNKNIPVKNFKIHSAAKMFNRRFQRTLSRFPRIKSIMVRCYYRLNGVEKVDYSVVDAVDRSIYGDSFDEFLKKYDFFRMQ